MRTHTSRIPSNCRACKPQGVFRSKIPKAVNSKAISRRFQATSAKLTDGSESAITAETKERLVKQFERIEQECEAARKRLAAAEYAYNEAKRAKDELDGAYSDELCDYGYTRTVAGKYTDPESAVAGAPTNVFLLGRDNFLRELKAIFETFSQAGSREEEEEECTVAFDMESCEERRKRLKCLQLSNQAIWDRERARPEIEAPWLIKAPYYVLCYLLDALFDGRPIQRFWFLETVARMPYFSYTTMLYLYETLGWWRRSSELRKVHFAEEWNEYHHLLVMESLGGDKYWIDRFLAQHSALVYYWVLVLLWLLSPSMAYNFSELIEAHAVDTYAQFADENEVILKDLPPPRIAREYYEGADLYLFDEFQTSREAKSRRPSVRHLHDVFCNIRDDEGEHVKTMNACQVTCVYSAVNKSNGGVQNKLNWQK
ncbi:hypothetical protein CYMTET_32035 [Cymbomonas tetramitiformis]|uniref:Ubiquinol oxidase n=1 Tax=Cymbomonas tetramitiformis TaxID=36881 RepID=A0AAE0FGF9_9CHLO|nr:hypothetical protein CYMTET_32035 [Cymbomonas tetramitiformis]